MESDLFKSGISKLLDLARERNVVLMCKERRDAACHRRFIVEALKTHGVEAIAPL